ncbi:MAG TPA: alpha/beta hydrolase [Acidimicrobiales bacterium]|nr:alpha/beta hydrolase [Acidimicrobiales bacterium]
MLKALGDGTLFGEAFGEGPVRVIWLHGWARRGQDFTAAARELAERGIASLAIDLPGFGASLAPTRAGGARYYADLVVPAIPEDGSLVLVGHSLGGRVAVVLAAAQPERYREVILVGAPLLRGAPGKSPWRYRLVRALARRHLLSPARLEAARQRFGSPDYRAASGVMRDVLVTMVAESYEDELSRLAVPLHLLWGANDTEARVDVAQRAITMVGAPARLTVLEGVGHLVPTESPEALVRAVLEALA